MTDRSERNLLVGDSARPFLLAGTICLVALCLTGVAVALLPGVQLRDIVALHDFTRFATPSTRAWENHVAELVDTGPAFVWGSLLVAVALVRRRPRLAVLVLVILLGSSASTELVKALVSIPRYSPLLGADQVKAHSWPSGHSTAAMALALCAVIVSPKRMRLVVAMVGALAALAISFSLLALAWHFPSDVIGGYLMAATWTCFGIAGLRIADDRWPRRVDLDRRLARAGGAERASTLALWLARRLAAAGRTLVVLACLATAVIASVIVVEHGTQALHFAASHDMLIVATVAISAVAVGLSGALAAALRR